MDIDRFSRRRFLLGAGTALALPLLPSIMRSGQAATPTAPKRFIFLFSSNGQKPANWYPPEPATWRELGPSVREAALPTTSGISNVCGPEFDALKPKLTLFRGLDLINSDGGGHNAFTPLSAARVAEMVTMDQVLAQSSKVYPTPPPVRSVHLVVGWRDQLGTTVSRSGVGGIVQDVPSQPNTQASWQTLFGGFVDETDPTAARKVALKAKVLDRVREEYDLVRQSPKLGAEDRRRLQAHVELIADLEARFGPQAVAACTAAGDPGEADLSTFESIPRAMTTNIDLLVAAIKCDRTRVATLMLCPGTDLNDFPFVAGGPYGEHHATSHSNYDDEAYARLAIMNHWYGTQVADLLAKLDVEEDPTNGTTYLDNSIVLWGNEDGCNDYDAHVGSAMPVLLAGSGGGALRTGRILDYRHQGTPILYDYEGSPAEKPTDFRGALYNSLLISLLQAMGLEPEDYETDAPGFGDYSGNYDDQYDLAAGRAPLPHLKAE